MQHDHIGRRPTQSRTNPEQWRDENNRPARTFADNEVKTRKADRYGKNCRLCEGFSQYYPAQKGRENSLKLEEQGGHTRRKPQLDRRKKQEKLPPPKSEAKGDNIANREPGAGDEENKGLPQITEICYLSVYEEELIK